MYKAPWIDMTTILPCPNRCKYCPQDLLMSKYKGKKAMSLETFKKVLENIPRKYALHFGGFGESFVNKDTVDMILYADSQGYKIGVWTTLVGLSEKDAERIKGIPFTWFHVHDIGQPKRDYPFIDEWKKVENPNTRAGNLKPVERTNKSGCSKSGKFNTNEMMPNGDVYICCMDWSLDYKLGSLLKTNLDDMPRPTSCELCHYCEYAR